MSRRPRIALAGATVLLTGATGGIGQAIARALAQRGARLLLTGRRRDLLEQLAAELGARALVADLAVAQDVDRLGAEAAAAGVDVLVANAGTPASGELGELSGVQVDRMLAVNLRAPIALAHGLVPMMTSRGSGQMVFISSLSGQVASPASSLYSATKFGLRGFALGIREDLRRSGVGVSLVVPGFISDAGMYAETGVKLPAGVSTRSPEQVAAAVIRAIERNPAEIFVAPLSLRAGAAFGSVAPATAALASRLMGSDRIAAALSAAQRSKR
ncbi:MAG TPA: SDR family NAD(P)-dependent oxidoreductase [Solirubrobacteraceae bacterium]|nr:SDR family NAD(P)-dependent oxidoreductase [Solirubrobacteraceae bacterium]